MNGNEPFDPSSRRGCSVQWGLGVVLGALLMGSSCLGSGGGREPSHLITRFSIGGVRLDERRSDVEAALGAGRTVHGDAASGATVHYAGAGLTIFYAGVGAPKGRTYFVATSDRRYRTAGGIGVGSTVDQVSTLAGVTCSAPRGLGFCETVANNGVPGLLFDVTGGRVTSVTLLVRTN